ncbi:MAG: hypothetical protein HOW73_37700 [Polyangiaceae bacterium]|nr:hypothetical protein [Polyangiaceae bacterium]
MALVEGAGWVVAVADVDCAVDFGLGSTGRLVTSADGPVVEAAASVGVDVATSEARGPSVGALDATATLEC